MNRKNVYSWKQRMQFILLLVMSISLYAYQQTGTLVIHAKNFPNSNGIAVAHLFRQEDDVPKKPFREEAGEIVADSATITFADLPYGSYALILFHDENSNGILDHKFFIPAEPMGFSNNWRLTLFSGMPNFSKLQFVFSPKHPECEIPIQ
jgi:uncharacterized protein (DUF2141 family)